MGYFDEYFRRGWGYDKTYEKYRLTPGYKALAAKPLFRECEAEHDRVAAALAAYKDPLAVLGDVEMKGKCTSHALWNILPSL